MRAPTTTPHHRPWLHMALLIGIIYFVVGRLFALPSDDVRVWRGASQLVKF